MAIALGIYYYREPIMKQVMSMKTRIQQGIVLAFFIVATLSCTPQKRLQRLIEKHPELVQADTIFIIDTLISPAIQADTAIIFTGTRDTLIVEREKLRVEVIRHTDTLYLNGRVAPDTIVNSREVVHEKLKIISHCALEVWLKKWGRWLFFGLGIGLSLWLLSRM